MAPDVPETDTRQADQARSWNPFTTQREGLPRARSYGKNMHHGNVIAKWTSVSSSKEVLHVIVDLGDGPVKGIGAGMVYLNDQPMGNFDGVSIQERTGTMDQTCMTGFEKLKLQYPQNNKRLKDDHPFLFTTPNDFINDIEWTLCFPNGLRHYDKQGSHEVSAVHFQVWISEHGLNSWTTVFDDPIADDKVSPKYKLYKVSSYLPTYIEYGKQYDLKIERQTADDVERTVDISCISSIREVVNTAFTHPGKALIGVTAIATSRLSGNLDVKVVSEDRLINVYDGSSWSIEYSRNRAWVVWDILTQPVISGNGDSVPYEIERYEGLDPARLDLPFFYEWAEWTSQQVLDGYGGTEDRVACDIKVEAATDIFSLAYDIAHVGRVNIYWDGHKLTGWIDKEVDGPVDLVTMDAMMNKTWKNSWAIQEELAGVVTVFYDDANAGYERSPGKFSNANAGSYKNSISVEGAGITTHGTAIHTANYLLERNRLILNTNTFRTHKDGFRYKLGEVVKLQCRIANWGRGYRAVESTANNTIKLDRDVTDEISPGDLLDIRVFDTGTQLVCNDTYTVAGVLADVVTIEETWIVAPIPGCRVAVAPSGDLKLRRVIKKKPTMDNYWDVTVETYDEDLFDADDLDPNNPNINYIWPAPAGQITGGPLTRSELYDLITPLLPAQPDIEIPWISNCTWTGDDVDTVTWSQTEETDPVIFRYKGENYEITPDFTTDEFIYWDPDFTTTFRTTNLASTALASGCWVVCVNKDGVAHAGVPHQLIHAGILLAGTIRAESYLELRQTYVYNGDDSLDSSKPLEIPFKIVSEMTALISVKLSFRIMKYRAYSTTAIAAGQLISDVIGESINYGGKTQTGYGGTGGTGYGGPSSTASAYVSDVPSAHSHNITSGSHYHSGPNHSHSMDTHTHSVTGHLHTIPGHGHGIAFGIHEESNSPTVHFHVNNGAGFGTASGNYAGDQLDIDITAQLSGTGWKGVRFDTNARCRIAAIIECKMDVTA